MKRISIKKLLERSGTSVEEVREQIPENPEQASQYFKFFIGAVGVSLEFVHLESTATSVMEEILRLPIEVQENLFASLAKQIKEPGEQAVLYGDKKKRGARVVRLASDRRTDHMFLLTH